jgi:hypothetical protein
MVIPDEGNCKFILDKYWFPNILLFLFR